MSHFATCTLAFPPSTYNQYATTHDERNAYPSCYRNCLVENKHSCQHAKYIAKRYHRISHGKGKVLDNVHPEDCCRSIADPTTEKPPVGKLARKEMYSPRESSHLLECKLKQNLSSTEQHTLHNGYQKQSHRAVYLISAVSSLPTPCQISTAVISASGCSPGSVDNITATERSVATPTIGMEFPSTNSFPNPKSLKIFFTPGGSSSLAHTRAVLIFPTFICMNASCIAHSKDILR